MKIFPTLALTLTLGLFVCNSEAAPRKINGLAAKANGKVVTKNEVSFLLAPRRAELAARHPSLGATYKAELKKAHKKILDELINRQLIIHEFNALGAHIPKHAVDAEIKHQINTAFNGSEKKFRAQLKTSGLSYTKFEKLTKDKLIGQAMRAQHFNGTTPATPAELNAEFAKHKKDLRDRTKDRISFERIVIPAENADDLLATPESQQQLTKDLIKQINKGANFTELAKLHSSGPFADTGGKQANKLYSDLAPGIRDLLFTEPKGKTIGPLKIGTPEVTREYHIYRVTKKIDGPAPPLAKVKAQIEQIVQNRKSSVRFKRYIDRIRKKAIIKYY